MRSIALIPVKSLSEGKSRLSSIMDGGQRRHLIRTMLERVIAAVQGTPVAGCLVVTPDVEVMELAWKRGAEVVQDNGDGLNGALELGQHQAIREGAESLLVVPGDLPLLKAGELDQALQLGSDYLSAVIAPCRRGKGTNLLFVTPPGLIPFHFGPDSFVRHLAEAEYRASTVRIFRAPGVAKDVDLPQDLRGILL